MKSMVGEIGTLKLNGEQIGGFKGWTVIQTPQLTKVRVSLFWILKKVNTNKLEAEFYTLTNRTLKLIRKENVIVNLPECELDKMITQPIEMDCGSFDWRE